jgi:hypothetical protein
MRLLSLSLIVLLFVSCEKNIDFNLNESANAVVVDAQIENGKAPVVVLSNSISYYSELNIQTLSDIYIHNANIFLSNGTVTHQLKEYTINLLPGLNTYFYSIDSASLATAFVGEFNTNYSLSILIDGKEYNSQTTIPALSVIPDSLYFKVAPNNPDTNARVLYAIIKDPRGLGNYFRYFTQRNDEPFLPGQNSVFTDEIIDGTTYNPQIEPGINFNNPPPPGDNFFHRGDSVTLKYCNIDKATYTFWNTWEFAYRSIGNPFAQPNRVIGNISNGGLGIFCGYASVLKGIKAQ